MVIDEASKDCEGQRVLNYNGNKAIVFVVSV